MSAEAVPAWKKAIIERRKKQEDDQKKKQAEEEAYLATLPPWKRALFQKREKEKREQEERERGATAESCNQQRQKQLTQERDHRNEPSTSRGWSQRVTPPTEEASDNEPTSPSSPTYGLSHQFFSAGSVRTPSPIEPGRRPSVTTLPDLDTPIAQKVANAPILPSTWQSRRRSSSESAGTSQKVVSNVKKFDEVKPRASEMPAWKKALLQRRKEKASHGPSDTPSAPKEPSVPVSSLPLGRKESPQEGLEETGFGTSKNERHEDSEPVSLLAVKKKSSPEEHTAVEPSLQLQRRQSPIEQVTEDSSRRSTPSPTVEVTHKAMAPQRSAGHSDRAQPKRVESKPPAFDRKISPLENIGFKRTESPTESRKTVSSVRNSHENTTAVSSAVKTAAQKSVIGDKLIPKRAAPVATKKQPQQTAASKQRERTSSSKPQQRPVPEIVNRGTSEQPPQQSHVIQTEGVTHRAPVYGEVGEWANVPENDPKFRSLPTWKQALIKRRRADIAKRKGKATSVDDVPLTNVPVPDDKQQKTEGNVQSEDRAADMPLWKKQMIQKKAEGDISGQMSSYEKKHLASRRESPTSSSSNIKSLMGRFNERDSSAPVVTVSRPPHSPSPPSTSPTLPEPPATSSQPPHSTPGVPQTASSTAHTTRRSFTWTPTEDTMPGEELSDDSSEEDEADQTVTNIDDISSSEKEEGEEEGGTEASSGVVLLKPPRAVVSPDTSEGRVRKTSSILVTTNRLKKKALRRVAFSESDLTVEHYYPKYDYSDYEDVQDNDVSTGFSFSFWKSREAVEAADSDEQNGLSQRLHPSLCSPGPDPDTYRYSPSRDSTVTSSPPPPDHTSPSTATLHNYKPSILSSYGEGEGDSLQQTYSKAMENGTAEEDGEETDGSAHLMPADGPSLSNFYASLSSDTAAMLW